MGLQDVLVAEVAGDFSFARDLDLPGLWLELAGVLGGVGLVRAKLVVVVVGSDFLIAVGLEVGAERLVLRVLEVRLRRFRRCCGLRGENRADDTRRNGRLQEGASVLVDRFGDDVRRLDAS